MTIQLAANHFCDLEEADPAAGAYRVSVDRDGVPNKLTAHCPCGCGQITSFPLYSETPERAGDGWVLSGDYDHHTLFPAVSFPRNDGEPGSHWDGWLIRGAWTRADAGVLTLATSELNVVTDSVPREAHAARTA